MNKRTALACVCCFVVALWFLIPPTIASAQTWEMVWSDEFDGNTLDPNKWTLQTGDGCPDLCGWGNNELEWYTTTNHAVSNGILTIEAREEQVSGKNYTSSRLRSINRGDWTYGRFEVRAKLPTGQGLWPAIWMLPTDPSIYGVWAASGEIDIMEMTGDKPNEIFGTIHYGGSWPNNVFSGTDYVLDSGTFNDDFHVFAIEWEEGAIRWYVDDELYASRNNWSSTGGPFPAPFDVDFHLLLNVAVGGNLPGSPDASTVFPQTMMIDYVRVYENTETTGDSGLLFDDMEHGDPDLNNWFSFDGGGGGIAANNAAAAPDNGGSFSLSATYPLRSGYIGGFGRTNRMNLADATHFNFWINPEANQDYILEMQFQDDDDGDDLIPTPSNTDDEFQFNCVVSPSGPCAVSGDGWQLVSIPFTDLVDDNSFHNGGNGVFDPVPTTAGGNGQLVNVVVTVVGNNTAINFDTDNWAFSDGALTTSTDEFAEIPHEVALTPAYPNPFSSVATFSLALDQAQRVSVSVFDLLGRQVSQVFDGMLAATEQQFELDGSSWPNGVYLLKVEGDTFLQTRQLVLMR
ncbi:MAG: family 16 glycosylhydrolase [Bacteroidota bacterium]